MGPERVGESIPAQIETGAGADLAQAEGERDPGGNTQKAAQQDSGAADLVRLGRRVDGTGEERGVVADGCQERGPELAIRGPAGRGQLARQGRRAARERQIVQAAEEAQRQRAKLQITRPARDNLSDRSVALNILSRTAHLVRPKRRAQRIAISGLPAKSLGNVLDSMCHRGLILPQISPDSPLEIR